MQKSDSYIYIYIYVTVKVLVTQLCLNRCDPMDVCVCVCVRVCIHTHSSPLRFVLECWIEFTVLYSRNVLFEVKWSEITQSCPTLCDPMDYSPTGSSIHGILQARILEWVAISFSRDLLDAGIEPMSSSLQADVLTSEPPGISGTLLFIYPI